MKCLLLDSGSLHQRYCNVEAGTASTTLASGTWPDQGWQGIKNPRKPQPQGQPSLARPGHGWPGPKLAQLGIGKRKNLGLHGLEWPGQARAKQWSSLLRTSASQARIKLNWRAAYFRPGCIGSGCTSSDMEYNYSAQAARPQNLSVALIWLFESTGESKVNYQTKLLCIQIIKFIPTYSTLTLKNFISDCDKI